MATAISASSVDVKIPTTLLTPEEKKEFEGYEFPFENLAFEGGGSKAMAYVGVVRVLEELNILKNIKRFAGASAGAIAATYLAVGFDSYGIQEIFEPNFQPTIYDGRFGIMGNMVNIYRHMGAHPGKRLTSWLNENIEKKTGNADYTFKQLYKERGVELCVITVDLTLMDAEYLHVKTAPNMSLSLAARASASIPGVVRPISFNDGILVDGGLLCNYPIHAFDGWFLSMDYKDSFFSRVTDFENLSEHLELLGRFDGVNRKSLGVLVYSQKEKDIMKNDLEARFTKYSKNKPCRPDTKLCRKHADKIQQKDETMEKTKAALKRLMAVLRDADENEDGTISREEFKKALAKKGNDLSSDDIKLLFECENCPDTMFDTMDINKDGQIDYYEFLQQASKRGIDIVGQFRGYDRCKIESFKDFLGALADSLMLHSKKVTQTTSDFDRTIGVNTDYLDTLDWDMQVGDKEFLIQCGKEATLCYLREHIAKNDPSRKAPLTVTNGTAATDDDARPTSATGETA